MYGTVIGGGVFLSAVVVFRSSRGRTKTIFPIVKRLGLGGSFDGVCGGLGWFVALAGTGDVLELADGSCALLIRGIVVRAEGFLDPPRVCIGELVLALSGGKQLAAAPSFPGSTGTVAVPPGGGFPLPPGGIPDSGFQLVLNTYYTRGV